MKKVATESEQIALRETIEAWENAKTALNVVKTREMELRKKICAVMFEGKEGRFSKTATLLGFKLKATSTTNMKIIDKDELIKNFSRLSDDDKACIKFTPELKEGLVRKLDEKSRLLEFIEEKPGAPTLELLGKI